MSRVFGTPVLGALEAGLFDYPTSLIVSGDATLQAFYRVQAGKVTAAGGFASQIADHTAYARHADQASGPRQAALDDTEATWFLSFFGGQVYEAPASLAAAMAVDKQNWTMWSVRRLVVTSGNQGIIAVGALGGMAETVEAVKPTIRHQGQTAVADGAATTARVLVVSMRAAGTDYMAINGVRVALGASGGQGNPSGRSYIGALLDDLTFPGEVDLSESGFMSRVKTGLTSVSIGAPTTGELAALWSYARAWYAL